MANNRKIFNDPVYNGFQAIDDDVIFDVIEHPIFQRERRIKQLGFTYLVYPGAMQTRFSHMLGALNLTKRALEVLSMKGVEISDEERRGAELAILLHDIGHGPFSHTSEYMFADVSHETLTELIMERLNRELCGKLDTAIAIFKNEYHKHFLHELVSSQLDMDRLDYLGRDSFFTGVSEGIVGTDRIIAMLNVHDDELVVDEKGIYSVEKFIISRRLMYWQVYMHKTVIAADELLLQLIKRARVVGVKVDGPLGDFLAHRYSKDDFMKNSALLDRYAEIDDDDVMVAMKKWARECSDKILKDLSNRLINRRLCAVQIDNGPFGEKEMEGLKEKAKQKLGLDENTVGYYVATGELHNRAYSFNDREIKVLFKDGSCKSISEASDQLDRHFLEKQVTKHFLYYPKEIR